MFTTQELFDAVNADPRVKAYPRLVEMLRTMNHMCGDHRGGYCICPRNDGSAPDEKHASGCADVRSLLRELGEE